MKRRVASLKSNKIGNEGRFFKLDVLHWCGRLFGKSSILKTRCLAFLNILPSR